MITKNKPTINPNFEKLIKNVLVLMLSSRTDKNFDDALINALSAFATPVPKIKLSFTVTKPPNIELYLTENDSDFPPRLNLKIAYEKSSLTNNNITIARIIPAVNTIFLDIEIFTFFDIFKIHVATFLPF